MFGWRIHADGSAEFSGVTVRGLFEAKVAGHPTVQFGNNVGPSGSHFGLSLSGTDFNNIFLRRADGIVFFRVNSGGASSLEFDSASGVLTMKGTLTASDINASIVRNADSSSYLDLRPGTPSGYLLNTPNAKILASGATKFSNVVAEGAYSVPFGEQFFANGETKEFVIPIGPSYSHASDQSFGAWSAAVEVQCSASLGLTTVPNYPVVYFDNEATVSFRSLVFSNSGGTDTVPSSSGQVSVRVKVTARINLGSASIADMRAQVIYWRVFKVT